MAETKTIASAAAPTRYSRFDGQYIAGTWRHGRQGEVEIDNNPYSGETLAEIVMANRDDLHQAYQAAAKAQKAWETVLPAERAVMMWRAAAVMRSRKEELVDWLIRESGSTHVKAELEWQFVHSVTLAAGSSIVSPPTSKASNTETHQTRAFRSAPSSTRNS
jgi:aldehyde dehydrogenase (NAD+)